MTRIVCIGEAMLELTGKGGDWQLGYGGDTLNTAIHLARAGHDVAYLTALGSDPLSAGLKAKWAGEGLDTALVLEHPARSTGLYAITTDAAGERSFTYWRETSAAREMFALAGISEAMHQAAGADLLVFSLISLAILPPADREQVLGVAARVRASGGRTGFDGNYRQRLWASREEAMHWRNAAIGVADIGLPTLDDEALLSGEASADHVAAHWQALGCMETVVKLGPHGCRLPGGEIVAPDAVLVPIDTSGAGDAFNAGYLSARLKGSGPAEAARAGHALAGWTIMRPGGIPARDS